MKKTEKEKLEAKGRKLSYDEFTEIFSENTLKKYEYFLPGYFRPFDHKIAVKLLLEINTAQTFLDAIKTCLYAEDYDNFDILVSNLEQNYSFSENKEVKLFFELLKFNRTKSLDEKQEILEKILENDLNSEFYEIYKVLTPKTRQKLFYTRATKDFIGQCPELSEKMISYGNVRGFNFEKVIKEKFFSAEYYNEKFMTFDYEAKKKYEIILLFCKINGINQETALEFFQKGALEDKKEIIEKKPTESNFFSECDEEIFFK